MNSKGNLDSSDLKVAEPADHEFVDSIHFFDPDGIRLGLTSRTVPDAILEESGAQCASGWSVTSGRRGPNDTGS